MTKNETITLRNGQTVIAKQTKFGLFPSTYANRTQAERKAEQLRADGINADVAQFLGRPFYVRLEGGR